MNLEPRPYRSLRDFEKIQGILIAGRAAHHGSYYVHVGDVNWWLFYPDQSAEFARRIFVWEVGEEVLGWCLLTPADNFLDVFVHPRWHGTPEAEAMFIWAEDQLTTQVKAAGGTAINTMWIFEDDVERRAFLEQRGFTVTARDYFFTRALTDEIPALRLPEGYHLRPTSGEDEYEERARASYGAFQSKWEWGAYLQRRLGFMRSPFYEREHDVVVAAPDQRIASFCIFWLDAVNRVGHFEPVGTHPDFQRRGCGKALMFESLRRLQALGMTSATVCTNDGNEAAVRLYQSVGFHLANRLLIYRKSCV